MLANGQEKTVPQTEEGITQAEWIGRERLGEVLKETYPSIREVFRHETFYKK